MANPTSSFGWQMPTNTDLVKDLPSDFEVFGQAVDDSFADLKGGTTGQVLSKTSGTDLDFTWVTPTDQIPLTTKGDLLTYDTGDVRLAVGTDGYVLTADSAESKGIKWAAIPVSAPTFVGCKAYLSGNKTIATATSTALDYEAESFDTDSFHDNSTNPSRFTIPSGKGGKYRIDAQVWFNQVAGSEVGLRSAALFKNGTQISTGFLGNTATDESTAFTISHVEDCAVSDYLQLFVYHTQGSNVVCSAGVISNSFTLTYLGA